MKLTQIDDAGVIYVNPAHVVAVEELQDDDGKPVGVVVIFAQTVTNEDGLPAPLTVEVEGTAEEVAKSLGLE
jgi:hypothetical protein